MAINPVAAGPSTRAGLVDAIDHLLNRGVVLTGDAMLSVAGVDLVYVGINLLLSSVETLQEHGDRPSGVGAQPAPPAPTPPGDTGAARPEPVEGRAEHTAEGQARVAARGSTSSPRVESTVPGADGLALSAEGLSFSAPGPQAVQLLGPTAGDPDAEGPERPLARLVLTLVELLRELLERQALRRMEGNRLSEEQIERMGSALLALSEKMAELRAVFGLEPEDLTIDLGPLGRLI